MRKGNWLVIAILFGASVLFLIMWHHFDFDLIHGVDLAITIFWWVVILGVCVAIKLAEENRRQSVRTAFLAPGLIYNSESGIVRVPSDEDMVSALQQVLANLRYDMVKAEVPKDSHIRFNYVVRTSRFSQEGKQWMGELVKVRAPEHPKPFKSREELTALLSG